MFTELRVRNVQEAYVRGLKLVRDQGFREQTRNGPALVVPWPVMTVYERPLERVLLDPARDANPFFHLMESIWMLAGRRDVASLEVFNAGLKKYSDDGTSYHGAYGCRWRSWFPQDHDAPDSQLDQLAQVIDLLRANPADRRVVLQMWDPTTDLGQSGLDFPCNTQVYFRTRKYRYINGDDVTCEAVLLDMTVMCRSNDAIWGAYGANAVHFSVLQEFVAAACGFEMGTLYQLSNNLHAYEDVMERVGTPNPRMQDTYYHPHDRMVSAVPLFAPRPDTPVCEIFQEVEDWWDDKLFSCCIFSMGGIQTITSTRAAYLAHKSKDRENALRHARAILAPDWRRACIEWLERRYAPGG